MSRNVFISILGTNHYLESKYYFGKKPNGNEITTRFIQEALMENICANWTENDIAYFFVTKEQEGSKEKNWNHPAQKCHPKGEYNGLSKIIEINNYKFQTQEIEIEDGLSEKEIWDIFETIFKVFQINDNVYFDITHSFRSIPMFSLVLLNYTKLLKGINVCNIFYGAFEKLGPAYKVIEIPVEERYAPILELEAFSELQDWTNASQMFVEGGNTKGIVSLLNDDRLKLQEFSDDILTCRGLDIYKGNKIVELKNKLRKLNPKPTPFVEIKQLIQEKISNYNQSSVNNGFEAVKFCIDHRLVQQGITLLQEFIITKVMFDIGINNFDKIKSYRNRKVIDVTLQKSNKADVKIEKFLSDRELTYESKKIKKLCAYSEQVDQIFKLNYKEEITEKVYIELSDKIRNDINHAGFRPDSVTATDLFDELKNKFEIIKSLFNLS